MIFIVSTIIGTPLAVAGKFIGTAIGAIVSNGEYRTIYKYVGFVFGAVIALEITVNIFSSTEDKIQMAFIGNCTQNGNGTRTQCECIYNKLDDKYDNLENVLRKKPDEEFQKVFIKYTKECILEE